jgi:ubiquitin-conjugating enzyme E2 J1
LDGDDVLIIVSVATMSVNARHPAVRRILTEVKELQKNPSSDYAAAPLENNIFEWHFTIRGPPDTDFHQGIYHGKIFLPADYPFKPVSHSFHLDRAYSYILA